MESEDEPFFWIPSIRVQLWDICLVKLLLLPAVTLASFPSFSTIEPVITLDEYNLIQMGMTIKQVNRIVGESGDELEKRNPTAPGMTNFQIFQWKNRGGSHALVWFQDGKVVMKVNVDVK